MAGIIKQCEQCNKNYKTKPSHYDRRKYCSYKCFDKARKTTLLGENNPCWRGGLPKCSVCNKELKHRKHRKEGMCVICYRIFNRGENHYNWQGGITKENSKIRNSLEYKKWRKIVMERDKYICCFCGVIGGKLQVDHIKPFSLYPELRFSIDNGRTLCIDCHKKTDTFLSKMIKFKKYDEQKHQK